MCEETKPDRADIGAWRKGTRKAYCVGDPCRRRRRLRNGAVLCGGTDHGTASCGAKCVCRLFAVALVGFLLRTVLYNGAHGISHTVTFAIPKTIRQKIIEKLPCLPLGTVADMQSGTLKDIIVDRVDSMETLAHLFPEMTANLSAPFLPVVYLFVLDEATANVDPENEDRLPKAIEALTRDKTVIMIAHRLKTVRHADKILVIDHGRIVQQGKHEQRIRENGIYADFVGGKKESVGRKL